MDVETVMGIALLTLLAGAGVGYFLGKGRGTSTRVKELEAALATSQTELADYRREVYGQFAQTAEKFRALDDSYNDLHRQLAASSVALCGDDATPLLAGPGQSLLADTQEEKTVDSAADDARMDSKEETMADKSSHETAPDEVTKAEETIGEERKAEETIGESPVDEETSAAAEQNAATQVPREDEDIIVAESSDVSDVPVLTETEEADESAASRRSA